MKNELSNLQKLKQTKGRAEFNKNKDANEARIKELQKLQHNYERSQDMAWILGEAGLPNNPSSNALLLEHLLDVGQHITASNSKNFVSQLAGPRGTIRVETTWKILPDERSYLATIILKFRAPNDAAR